MSAEFTKEMRSTHTIYIPYMLHYQNALLKAAFQYAGYKLAVVPEYVQLAPETMTFVNSSYCTCAVSIVGSLLAMLKDPAHADEKIAVLEPQVSSACRAGNYYNLIADCLHRVGREDIPVISLNIQGLKQHSGFNINFRLVVGALAAVCYSDLLMTLLLQVKPYELEAGSAEAMHRRWLDKLGKDIAAGKRLFFRKKIYREIVKDFKSIALDGKLLGTKKKVGVVGEIFIKCSPAGNCHLEDFLDANNCEHRMVGFMNYCIYSLYAEMVSDKLSGANTVAPFLYRGALAVLCRIQEEMNRQLKAGGYCPDGSFKELLNNIGETLSDSYVAGDGWLVCGEIVDHIKRGYDRVLVVHPFGCLVSHVAERGIIKELRSQFPDAAIHSIEFDRDQSPAMRESRVQLAIH